MNSHCSTARVGDPFDRLVAGLEETRLDLGLSRECVARLVGLTAQTVRNIERGRSRNVHAALKLRTALTVLELAMPPARSAVDADLMTQVAAAEPPRQLLVQPQRRSLAQPPLPAEPWPAGSAA